MSAPIEADKELDNILGGLYYLDEEGGWQTKDIGYQSYEQSKSALLAWRDKAVVAARIDEHRILDELAGLLSVKGKVKNDRPFSLWGGGEMKRKAKYELAVYLNGKLIIRNLTGFTIEKTLNPNQTVITIPEDITELLDAPKSNVGDDNGAELETIWKVTSDGEAAPKKASK